MRPRFTPDLRQRRLSLSRPGAPGRRRSSRDRDRRQFDDDLSARRVAPKEPEANTALAVFLGRVPCSAASSVTCSRRRCRMCATAASLQLRSSIPLAEARDLAEGAERQVRRPRQAEAACSAWAAGSDAANSLRRLQRCASRSFDRRSRPLGGRARRSPGHWYASATRPVPRRRSAA